jgi:integrase
MASIRKRTLPSGKAAWLVDYVDQAGKRRAKQFGTKREADAWMVTARAEVRDGVHSVDRESITVEKAGDLWLARCEADGLQRTTLNAYREHLKLHIVPRIGATKLSRLTAPAVAAFRDKLVADGRSDSMVRRVMVNLGAIVSDAQRAGLVAVNNVAAGGKSKRGKREKARVDMPTKDELKALLGAAAPGRETALVTTALLCGLRGSELRGLQWEDVDFKEKQLRIRRRVDRYGVFGPPKSEAGVRDIPLSAALVLALKAWKLACPKGDLGLVFPNGAGNVESHNNLLNRLFGPLQIRAKVVTMVDGKDAAGEAIRVASPKFGLHALRHAAASLWIEQGLNAKRVMTLMGHASIEQTFDVYGYLFEARGEDETAMDSIASALLS